MVDAEKGDEAEVTSPPKTQPPVAVVGQAMAGSTVSKQLFVEKKKETIECRSGRGRLKGMERKLWI